MVFAIVFARLWIFMLLWEIEFSEAIVDMKAYHRRIFCR